MTATTPADIDAAGRLWTLAVGTPNLLDLAAAYALFHDHLPMRLTGNQALNVLFTTRLDSDLGEQLVETGNLMRAAADTGIAVQPENADRIQIAWVAGWDAVRALTCRHLIGEHDGWTQDIYDHLTRPWRLTVGTLHPDDAEFPNSWFTIQPAVGN